MDWNRQQHILQKWQPFGIQPMQIQQQQIQHQLQQQQQQQQQQQPPPPHQQQPPPPQAIQQVQPQIPQPPQQSTKISKASGGSATPHCLVCNVHLGMFAKGGMEVFSDKVTTTHGKVQINSILSNIVNHELSSTAVHSSIICKKCFKLIDDIDAMEDKLVNMKQVVSTKYTMTMALVKKGLVGKAVIDEHTKEPERRVKKPKPPDGEHQNGQEMPSSSPSPEKIGKVKSKTTGRRGRPPGKVGRPRKTGNLTVKAGKVVVKQVQELQDESNEEDEIKEENSAVVIIDEADEFNDVATAFMCSVCDKAFETKQYLLNHVESHDGKEDWHACNICQKHFMTTTSLAKHKKLHKGKRKKSSFDHKMQFKCRQCSKIFSTKSKAKDHERTHTGEKPFECDICGTCFRQKSNLSSHKRVTHLQERRYKCQICGKAFKWKRLLNGHTMSVHTGERPYRCEFCDAGFVYQQHYKKHMRIHTGEKPFKCEICGKAFNSSNNCRAHMFTHSDKKPYECRICGAGFMRKPLVLSHIKQHPHVDNVDGYVKANSPSAALPGASGVAESNGRVTDPAAMRKKKVVRENTQPATAHMGQAPSQSHNMEESVPHFVIPDGREQSSSGEAMNYVFGAYQTPGTMSHYSSLNLGQW